MTEQPEEEKPAIIPVKLPDPDPVVNCLSGIFQVLQHASQRPNVTDQDLLNVLVLGQLHIKKLFPREGY